MIIWHEHVKPYQELLDWIRVKFEKANSSLYKQLGYAPIESVKTRIKSEASARKKLQRKNLEFNEKNLTAIQDIAGVRVVCRFMGDIPEIVSLVKGWESLKVINQLDRLSYEQVIITEELDYVDKPKDSGYRSYHLICRKGKLYFEIQIRTIAMDFWASAEHMLKYKYTGGIPDNLQEKLRSMADIASTLDYAMNDIRQDVNLGTAMQRALDQVYKAIGVLDASGLKFKADHYREQLEKNMDDLEALKSLSIRAREDVPAQYWRE